MQVFNGNKAGMDGIDKERIQKIIDENTSSDFEGHEKKRKERTDARIKRYKEIIAKMTPQQIAEAKSEMDVLVGMLEMERDLSRYAVHVDMDAFFAAVEMRDDPSLRSIPMAVGSDSMLSTSNYAARRYGIRAAMPGFIAKKLNPELRIIRPHFDRYRKASSQAREVFKDYDPNFCMYSVDEAYLDFTDCVQRRLQTGPVEHDRIRYTGICVCRLPLIAENEMSQLVDAEIIEESCTKCGKLRKCVRDRITFGVDVDEVVREMRFRVEQATGLTCSAGIAPNSVLAKVCSDINKPNGQFRVINDREAVLSFMKDLPIRKINGVGPVTEAVLKGIGLEKCGDLYEQRGMVGLLFTQFNYEYFLRIALGIFHVYTADRKSRRKSISTERTFHPTGDLTALLEITDNLCSELIDSLPDHGIRGGRTATVKMKYSTFDVITRCCSVDYTIADANRLFALCSRFVHQEMHDSQKQLRLLGVRLSRLIFEDEKVEASKPLSSFWKPQQTEAAALDFVSDASNESIFPSSSKLDETSDSAEESDDAPNLVSDAVVCFEDDSQRCPICNSALPEELILVNRHIDECLNRQAIAELRSDSTTCKNTAKRETPKAKNPKKRPAKKKVTNKVGKQNSIENYLVKVQKNM